MDFKQIISKVQLPKITSCTGCATSENIAVIVPEDDFDGAPFKVVADNHIREELKKNKCIQLYGKEGDGYKKAWVCLYAAKTTREIISAGADLTRAVLHKGKVTDIVLHFSEKISAEHIDQFLSGFFLTNHSWNEKTSEGSQLKRYESVTVCHKTWKYGGDGSFQIDAANYVLFGREIANSRANKATPSSMLKLCQDLAKAYNLDIEYIVGKDLEAKGLNLIYSVGKGASEPPCLVVLRYNGNPSKPEDLYSLVGKGVCFDAGGLNIKPTGSMEEMYADKTGACVVLSTFLGIVEKKLPINVVVGVFWVENKLGSDAYRPSDILTSYKGLTIEIGNTDAEGRLCLADTMSYVQKNYKPHTLVEFSTLTGACVIALGFDKAGVWTNSDQLWADLSQASTDAAELIWRMPITDEDRENTKTKNADLGNAVPQKFNASGCNRAAAFLEFFVEQGVNWAHVDIAGPGLFFNDKYTNCGGASGYGIKLMLNYFKRRAQSS